MTGGETRLRLARMGALMATVPTPKPLTSGATALPCDAMQVCVRYRREYAIDLVKLPQGAIAFYDITGAQQWRAFGSAD